MNSKKKSSKDAYFGSKEAEKPKLKILTKTSIFWNFDFPICMNRKKESAKDAYFGTKEAEKAYLKTLTKTSLFEILTFHYP